MCVRKCIRNSAAATRAQERDSLTTRCRNLDTETQRLRDALTSSDAQVCGIPINSAMTCKSKQTTCHINELSYLNWWNEYAQKSTAPTRMKGAHESCETPRLFRVARLLGPRASCTNGSLQPAAAGASFRMADHPWRRGGGSFLHPYLLAIRGGPGHIGSYFIGTSGNMWRGAESTQHFAHSKPRFSEHGCALYVLPDKNNTYMSCFWFIKPLHARDHFC